MPHVPVRRRPRALRRLVADSATAPLAVTVRHGGTNGWTSSWGTNAHGEIAGCPPEPAA